MEFKEIDFVGEETLKSMSHGVRLNQWMYSQIKPYIREKTLEVGSGIGNISQYFIQNGKNIDLSDIRDQYINYLRIEFPNNKILKIDLVHEEFNELYKDLFEQYDLIYALNVIEHIENDKLAIFNACKLLKPNGILYVLVPAHKFLFNSFDKSLMHFRRYNKNSLKSLFPSNMKYIKGWYFNLAGIFGWYVVGNILNKKIIPQSNMKLYNFLTPLFKLMDLLTFRKVGLSAIVVFKKINNE